MKCAVCGVHRNAFADDASWHAHLAYCLAEARRERLTAVVAQMEADQAFAQQKLDEKRTKQRMYNRTYRERHPDRVREQWGRQRQRQRVQVQRERARRIRLGLPLTARQIMKRMRDNANARRRNASNPEAQRLRQGNWRARNPDRARALGRQNSAKFRSRHRDESLLYQTVWRQDHPDKVQIYNLRKKQYRQDNHEVMLRKDETRRRLRGMKPRTELTYAALQFEHDVANLKNMGLSLRAIAATLGRPYSTVEKARGWRVHKHNPGLCSCHLLAGEAAS